MLSAAAAGARPSSARGWGKLPRGGIAPPHKCGDAAAAGGSPPPLRYQSGTATGTALGCRAVASDAQRGLGLPTSPAPCWCCRRGGVRASHILSTGVEAGIQDYTIVYSHHYSNRMGHNCAFWKLRLATWLCLRSCVAASGHRFMEGSVSIRLVGFDPEPMCFLECRGMAICMGLVHMPYLVLFVLYFLFLCFLWGPPGWGVYARLQIPKPPFTHFFESAWQSQGSRWKTHRHHPRTLPS